MRRNRTEGYITATKRKHHKLQATSYKPITTSYKPRALS